MPEWALDEESRLSSQGSSVNFAGQIKPLPAVVFPIEEAPDALRQLSGAKHIGKVVVQVPNQLPAPKEAPGRWIISGGLGALGTLSVQWLASQGNMSYLCIVYHLAIGQILNTPTAYLPVSGEAQGTLAKR